MTTVMFLLESFQIVTISELPVYYKYVTSGR